MVQETQSTLGYQLGGSDDQWYSPAGDGGAVLMKSKHQTAAWAFARELRSHADLDHLQLRIGIHQGQMVVRDSGPPVGPAMFKAEDACTRSPANGICVTASFWEDISDTQKQRWQIDESDPNYFLIQENVSRAADLVVADNMRKIEGAGEVSDCNPFRFFRTDDILSDDLSIIHKYFADPFDFADVLAPGNTIIEGHRGSGKSWILRYMSSEVQFEAGRAEEYIGFYVKCKPTAFDCTKRRGENDDQWRDFFNHYLNTFVISRVVSALSQLSKRNLVDISSDQAKSIVRYIHRYVFPNTVVEDSIDVPTELLYWLYQEIERNGDDCRVRRDSVKAEQLSTAAALEKLVDFLKRTLPQIFGEKRQVYILLDEFDNLDSDQQSVMLTHIRNRMPGYAFKVAVQTFYMREEDLTGRRIQRPHDYTCISTDRFTPQDKTKYLDFLRRVADTRLTREEFGIDIETLLPSRPPEEGSTVEWLGKDYSGFENYAMLASGIVRDFVSLVKDTVYYQFPKIAKQKVSLVAVPWKIQNKVILVKSAMHFRDISGRNPEEVKSIVVALGRLFRQIIDLSINRYKTEPDLDSGIEAERRDKIRQVSRIFIPDETRLSELLRDHLREAVKNQLLQIPLHPREPQVHGEIATGHYLLHRLLCPFFRLSLMDRHPRRISASVFELALSNPNQFVAQLTKQLQGSDWEIWADHSEDKVEQLSLF